MKKRVLSIILAAVLVMALCIPAYAASFTDLKGHWAEKYLTDMADRKLLTGYSDNTMKPDKSITNVEALVFLSRLYTVSDTEMEYLREDYAETVKASVATDYAWAYDSLEICLATGIVTKDELKAMNLGKEISKEQIVIYIVRAMKLTAEAQALSSVELPFTDAASISAAGHGSVAQLVSLKITGGDENKNFSPNAAVTRAVAATMISRAIDYLESKSIDLTVDAYDGISRLEGIITAISSSSVSICGYNGLVMEYALPTTAKITVNGTAKTVSSDYVASHATLSIKNKAVTAVAIDYNTKIKYVQGTLSVRSTSYIYIGASSINTAASYNMPTSITITRSGKTVAVSELCPGLDFITMTVKDSVITSIIAEPGSLTLAGTVDEVTCGSTNTLKIVDTNGLKYSFKFDIDSLPTITRAGKTITIDRLKKGSSVKLTFNGSTIKTIAVEGTEATVSGRLYSYTASADGVNWVLSIGNEKRSYTVDENVAVYYGKTLISLSDVKIDDQVSVLVYDGTITEVTLLTSESSPTKATGTVIKIDTKNKLITILNSSDKLEYIDITNLVSVLESSTGRTSSGTSYISTDSRIVAYGAYTSTTNFTAKSIVVE